MAEDQNELEVEDGGGDADARPDWLPQEFESPEALAKSYGESRRLIEERGREANELRDRLEQMEAQLEQAVAPRYDDGQNPLEVAYTRAFEEGDVRGMLAVQAQIAQAIAQQTAPAPPQQDYSLIAQFAENQVRAAHPDYDQYRDEAMQVLQQNPSLVPEGSSLATVQNGITAALEVARGRVLYQQQQQTDAQKQQQAEAARLAKLNSQTVPSSGTRPQSVDQQSDLWAAIKAADPGGFKLPT